MCNNLNVFFAGGQMSKAPKFSNAYLAYSNLPNTGAKNESITSVDVGVSYRSNLFDVTTTYYMNTWKDKSIVLYDAPDIYNITGLSADHSGIEIEADVRPMNLLSLDASLSFGNWTWGENVDAVFSSDYDRTNTAEVKLYTDGKDDIHKKNKELEKQRFGTVALPYYVILSPDDKELATFP